MGMISTLCRFILQFKKTHPRKPERSVIDYEIITIAIPLVFLGTFLGINLAKSIGEVGQNFIFGFAMLTSIRTSYKKAVELSNIENAARESIQTKLLQNIHN